jgi:peptidoglycan lytic transglycosylase G
LRRSIAVLGLIGVALIIMAVICGGALFLISGGRPVDFVQKTIIRISLASRQGDLNRTISDDATPRRFTVNLGDTPRIIAQNLVAENLIADAPLFVDYVRLNDYDTRLQAGTYFLNQAESLAQIAVALTDSRSTQFPFRILEGWRLEEVAAAIDDNPYFDFSGADFLASVSAGAPVDPAFAVRVGMPPGASLEGFLYPDTYQLPAEVTPIMLRDILTKNFLDRVGNQLPIDAGTQGYSLFQMVTLASIIQREAVHADEQPLIASVYRNRLNDGMALEADPTVQYAIGLRDGQWWPQITIDDYHNANSPYNTYLGGGLPPGPIDNPGIQAIQAAVYPTASDYFFFRADCRSDGYHDFARTFAEHLAKGC